MSSLFPNIHYSIKEVDGKLKADVPQTIPDFKIYSGPMSVSAVDPQVVRMIGSSTEQDLHGDTMTLAALGDMAKAPSGLAVFLNHDYTVPESVFGGLADVPTITQQNGLADLHINVRVTDKNPRAQQTLDLIREGVARLGCSVGCQVTSYSLDTSGMDEDDPYSILFAPMVVTGVQTLEWSVVGIPANQRSWVEQAKKGIFARTLDKRLAPAIKSLFPKEYREIINRIDDKDMREDYAAVKALPRPEKQIRWDANRATFVLLRSGNDEGEPIHNPVEIMKQIRSELVNTAKEEHGAVEPVEMPEIEIKSADPEEAEEIVAEVSSEVAPELSDVTLLEIAAIEAPELDITDAMTPDLNKSATGSADWPLADRAVAWDNGEATKAVETWANGDAGKLASVHFYKDASADGSLIGSYKLLFCDVIGGSVKAVPRGIFACAGSHGVDAADIPSGDKDSIHGKISAYYKRMAKQFDDDTIVAPWDKQSAAEVEVTTAVENQNGLDAVKQAELDFYNMIGARLGLPAVELARDAEGNITRKDAAPAATSVDLGNAIRYAHRLDDTADILAGLTDDLLHAMGQPDSDDMAGTPDGSSKEMKQSADDILHRLIKSGARHSAADLACMVTMHKALSDMTDGMICGISKKADADGDNDGDQPGQSDGNNDSGVPGGAINMSFIPALKSFNTAAFENINITLTALVKSLEDLKLAEAAAETVKSVKQETEAVGNYVKELETAVIEATAQAESAEALAKSAQEQADAVKNAKLGRPSMLAGRTYAADEGAADFAEMLNLGVDKKLHLSAESVESQQTYEEIIKQLPVEYEKGVGYVRLWPEGVTPKGGRPELTNAQRACMTVASMLAYKEGREARVPVI